MRLVNMQKDTFRLKSENAELKARLNDQQCKIDAYHEKMARYDDTVNELNRQLKSRESLIHDMKGQLNQKQQMICQKELEKEKQKRKLDSRHASETNKLAKEMQIKLKEHEEKTKVCRIVE